MRIKGDEFGWGMVKFNEVGRVYDRFGYILIEIIVL